MDDNLINLGQPLWWKIFFNIKLPTFTLNCPSQIQISLIPKLKIPLLSQLESNLESELEERLKIEADEL